MDDINVLNGDNSIGPIASWSFDEGSGTSALDQVKGVKDYINYVFTNAKYKPVTEPEWRPGVFGSALLFDGYSTWIERPANLIARAKDVLTIEAWVAPRSYEWGDRSRLSAIVTNTIKPICKDISLGWVVSANSLSKWGG